jgi:hypothetical protein
MCRHASVLLGIVAAATVVTSADAGHLRQHDHFYSVGLATNDRAAQAYARARTG